MNSDDEEDFGGDFDDFAEAPGDEEDEEAGAGADLGGASSEESDAADSATDDDNAEDDAGDAAAPAAPAPAAPAPAAPRLVVIRDKSQYMTSNLMSRPEAAKVLAVRAEQIANHNNAFLPPGVAAKGPDPVAVALQELNAGMCPLIIRRWRTHGTGDPDEVRVAEDWAVNDLIVPPDIAGLQI